MSTHPNVMLLLALTPDGLARKTYRAILEEAGINPENPDGAPIRIEGNDFIHHRVMEDDYDDGFQVCLPPGTIYIADLLTYGYGEKIPWEELPQRVAELQDWAQGVCSRHHCSAQVYISANYW